ncbi:hypothetical protein [Paraburkholderia kururiensis]|uniref:Transmembrane protein n=1 Tax=Paraburkholderia kururiensis TaxID=984307 RepID=A0ABZ0WUV9_9BURK|nr:hypothetical protein [Paraburkholderia kururiensis]WQD81174.1 hypothetical protein U0042_26880 [Paraburkholderia kururiensis]
MKNRSGARRRRRTARWVHALVSSFALAIAVTWLGATYDHPVDAAIVAGMNAPECASVGAIPAGSLLAAREPESAVCRSFFLYRVSFADAAHDAPSYQARVLQQRVDEFWLLVGYVLALWFVVVCLIAGAALVLRKIVRHMNLHHP